MCGFRQGVEYLHGLSIVHGDLKPSNVLLDTDGHPKITDWGLSRESLGFTHSTMVASNVGYTRDFAAPEVLKKKQRTTFASDMWVADTPLLDVEHSGMWCCVCL